MLPYLFSQISKIFEAESVIHNDCIINDLILDSRKEFTPEHTIFIAINGVHHDGHLFIKTLYDKGLRNYIVENDEIVKTLSGVNYIKVENSVVALQKIATHHRNQFSIPIIGVTGSNGKTIIKEWIFYILSRKYRVNRNPKSYNSQVGVPLSVWKLNADDEIGVFEAGISEKNEMQNLETIIKPNIGVFANIGIAHQENFTNITEKIEEKLKLFINTDKIIFCKDHTAIYKAIEKQKINNEKHFSWSRFDDANLRVISEVNIGQATRIKAVYDNDEIEITIPFTDKGSIENSIHVWCVGLVLGLTPAYIEDRMKHLPQVGMRLEMKNGVNGCIIINDSYNSDLSSIEIALDFLAQQQKYQSRTLILSDILQTGLEPEELYGKVKELIENKKINRLIGIGDIMPTYLKKINIKSKFFATTDAFLKDLQNIKFENEAILIKGARVYQFEKISHALEEKVNRTIFEIGFTEITHNLNYFRSFLQPETKIMVMVKAFSYGSGTYEIASMLQFQRVDYLGVAFADEGVILRKAGIEIPIIVLNPEPESFHLFPEYNLEPEIFSYSLALSFKNFLHSKNIQQFPIHLKIDTGMNRSGFDSNHLQEFLEMIERNNGEMKIASVFSHLAASDEPMHDKFTESQISTFESMCSTIEQKINYSFIKHICNSAGVERFPQAHFNMVRLGIGLYGISAVDQGKVQQIGRLKSYISQIKDIDPSQTVGYGRKGVFDKPAKIAIVPIGYADGLNRRLSNGKGSLWVNNCPAPIVGNICMDICMIDITHIDCHEGDEVIIFDNKHTIIDLAKTLETIPYEVLTSISPRVKRVYYQD